MSLFLAPIDQDSPPTSRQPTADSRLDAQIIHVDNHSGVWIWVPKLHDGAQSTGDVMSLSAWAEVEQRPLRIADVNPQYYYRGLMRLEVPEKTLSIQRNQLNIANDRPSEWPSDCATLTDVIDRIDVNRGDRAIPRVKAIALFSSHNYEAMQRGGSLRAWLSSTQIPRAKLELATRIGFAEAMQRRPKLFEELRDLLFRRRMIHLLAGQFSNLGEFLDGFEKHLKAHHIAGWSYVAARFDSEAFRKIKEYCLFFPKRDLDALLTTLAFGAASGLKDITGQYITEYLTDAIDGRPLEFAKLYLRKTKALDHDDTWSCISDFLRFLSDMAAIAGFDGKVTVFLPFYRIEDLINGDDQMRHQLWDALSALQSVLDRQPETCPHLGVLLAAHSLPLHKAETLFIQRSVLQLAPLTRDEVDSLISEFLGHSPPQEALSVLDAHAGGDPFFVFLILRCLPAIIETLSPLDQPQKETEAVARACASALAAVSIAPGDNAPVLTDSAVPTRSIPAARDLAPDDVRNAVDEYIDYVTQTITSNRGALGSQSVLNAWAYPEGPRGRRFGRIDQIEHAWLATGLIYAQTTKDMRGSSLNCFKSYPTFQFSKAGTLPLRLAHTAQARARGEK